VNPFSFWSGFNDHVAFYPIVEVVGGGGWIEKTKDEAFCKKKKPKKKNNRLWLIG